MPRLPELFDTACPLCGSDGSNTLFYAVDRLGLAPGSFRLAECAECGLAFLSPRPDESELGGYYPRTYWGGRQSGIKELLRAFEERSKEAYKLKAVRQAGLGPCRIIDIGCGRGEFLALLRGRGFEVFGLEPGLEAARRGRDEYGIGITHGTLGGVRLPESFYGAATLWHVLEHLPDPLSALEEIRAALVPGGRLLVAVPDFGSWQAARFRQDWFGVDAPRHLTHFTRETLRKMLEKAGFRVCMVTEGGPRYETAMLVRSLFPGLNRRKLDALEAGAASKYFYKAAQLLLDMGLLPAGAVLSASGRGCTFTAVAEKV